MAFAPVLRTKQNYFNNLIVWMSHTYTNMHGRLRKNVSQSIQNGWQLFVAFKSFIPRAIRRIVYWFWYGVFRNFVIIFVFDSIMKLSMAIMINVHWNSNRFQFLNAKLTEKAYFLLWSRILNRWYIYCEFGFVLSNISANCFRYLVYLWLWISPKTWIQLGLILYAILTQSNPSTVKKNAISHAVDINKASFDLVLTWKRVHIHGLFASIKT